MVVASFESFPSPQLLPSLQTADPLASHNRLNSLGFRLPRPFPLVFHKANSKLDAKMEFGPIWLHFHRAPAIIYAWSFASVVASIARLARKGDPSLNSHS